MIAHLRIILDHNNDIFRDIHINTEDTLEQLHHAIVSAFTSTQRKWQHSI